MRIVVHKCCTHSAQHISDIFAPNFPTTLRCCLLESVIFSSGSSMLGPGPPNLAHSPPKKILDTAVLLLVDVTGSTVISLSRCCLPNDERPYLTLDLSSSRIQMDALGHTLTPFCSVCRQFFGFIPGDVHVLQISSDDVHPIFPAFSCSPSVPTE